VLSTRQANASQHAMLSLLGLLMSDADNEELAQALKLAPGCGVDADEAQQHGLCATRRPVSSVQEAIMVLGRAKIKRWSMLLLFASNATNIEPQRNPLLELAATRGRIMELLAEACYPQRRDVQESAS
jgi:EAL and modified HD-GYP domain-containing signal transduction protein